MYFFLGGGVYGNFYVYFSGADRWGSVKISKTPCTTGLGLNFLDLFFKDFVELLERFLVADWAGV